MNSSITISFPTFHILSNSTFHNLTLESTVSLNLFSKYSIASTFIPLRSSLHTSYIFSPLIIFLTFFHLLDKWKNLVFKSLPNQPLHSRLFSYQKFLPKIYLFRLNIFSLFFNHYLFHFRYFFIHFLYFFLVITRLLSIKEALYVSFTISYIK